MTYGDDHAGPGTTDASVWGYVLIWVLLGTLALVALVIHAIVMFIADTLLAQLILALCCSGLWYRYRYRYR